MCPAPAGLLDAAVEEVTPLRPPGLLLCAAAEAVTPLRYPDLLLCGAAEEVTSIYSHQITTFQLRLWVPYIRVVYTGHRVFSTGYCHVL